MSIPPQVRRELIAYFCEIGLTPHDRNNPTVLDSLVTSLKCPVSDEEHPTWRHLNADHDDDRLSNIVLLAGRLNSYLAASRKAVEDQI
jgi:hypothetical protein